MAETEVMTDTESMRAHPHEVFWFFIIYAFLGWIVEEIYVFLEWGVLVKRGFLHIPIGPIYGYGMLIVILALSNYHKGLFRLFIGSTLFITVFEYISGFLLYHLLGKRLWSYSEYPFNLDGYISLQTSILFGLACVFVIRLVHPHIRNVINRIPVKSGRVILIGIYAIVVADTIISIVLP
jgi:uncharacterized membrane protein